MALCKRNKPYFIDQFTFKWLISSVISFCLLAFAASAMADTSQNVAVTSTPTGNTGGGYYQLDITTQAKVSDFTLSFSLPKANTINSCWGANIKTQNSQCTGDSCTYTYTGASNWSNTAAALALTCGVNGQGAAANASNLQLNATTDGGSGNGGDTGAVPATPQLTVASTAVNQNGFSDVTVKWELTGTNAKTWTLYENGQVIGNANTPVAESSPNMQSASLVLNNRAVGTYTYKVVLQNDKGTSEAISTYTVKASGGHDNNAADAPATPQISVSSAATGKDGLSNITVKWNIWWGNNATSWALYENGQLIGEASRPLTAHTPDAQTASAELTDRAAGMYDYKVVVKNDKGTTEAVSTYDLSSNVTTPPEKPQFTITAAPATQKDLYNVTVKWDIWWGANATTWQLFENGQPVGGNDTSNPLADNSPNAQSESVVLPDRKVGVYSYKLVLTNAKGTTQSDTTYDVTVGSSGGGGNSTPMTSKITIDPADTTTQLANTLVIAQDTPTQFKVTEKGVEKPNFKLTVNNSTALKSYTVSADGTLTLVGASSTVGARTGLKIEDSTTGDSRYIGVAVKAKNGAVPGLPSYLAMGSVSQDDAGAINFWRDFGPGLKNKRMDVRYIYLNDGPGPQGWHTWGGGKRVSSFVNNSLQLGMIPFFVYYNINGGSDSYEKVWQNMRDATYMESYFKDLMLAATQAKEAAAGQPVGFILEADVLGYIQQDTLQLHEGVGPSGIAAATSAAYASGVLDQSDPQFPNTLTGLVKAINYTIKKYNPEAIVGWQLNLWGSSSKMEDGQWDNGGNGIIHRTERYGMEKGREIIVNNAKNLTQFAIDAGVDYKTDFIAIDKYGLDGGQQADAGTKPEGSTWLWNADLWNNYLLFVKTIHDTSKLPVILWQIPVGHIDNSTLVSPYTGNPFSILGNATSSRYEDSAPTFFLGDTFSATNLLRTNAYFALNLSNDPKISQNGSQITWGSHTQETVDSGVVAVLFGAGVGASTQGTPSPSNVDISKPTDDYWWITKAQQYFEHPTPLSNK